MLLLLLVDPLPFFFDTGRNGKIREMVSVYMAFYVPLPLQLEGIIRMDQVYLGAIDIGSNAVRLLIKHAHPGDVAPEFVKDLLVRVPLRLGDDVFSDGHIPDSKVRDLIRVMKAYQHLMRVYNVVDYRACATAAMREAKNSDRVIQRVKKHTDLKIEIIKGEEEAHLIYGNHYKQLDTDVTDFLYVDVGGGSTELNFVHCGELSFSRSYDIGTVRMLRGRVTKKTKLSFQEDLDAINARRGDREVILVGSGGNINRLYRIAHVPAKDPLAIDALRSLQNQLEAMSVQQRAEKYQLREDRADVIVPAGKIFLHIADALDSKKILVPTLGLADGIIRELFLDLRTNSQRNK